MSGIFDALIFDSAVFDTGDVIVITPTGGWPKDRRKSWKETEALLLAQIEDQRIELGIVPRPEAVPAVLAGIAAQERATTSVDTEAKLSAALAQMEAEELFANVYARVKGEMERERLAELYRMEMERERVARRRRAVQMLLLN